MLKYKTSIILVQNTLKFEIYNLVFNDVICNSCKILDTYNALDTEVGIIKNISVNTLESEKYGKLIDYRIRV